MFKYCVITRKISCIYIIQVYGSTSFTISNIIFKRRFRNRGSKKASWLIESNSTILRVGVFNIKVIDRDFRIFFKVENVKCIRINREIGRNSKIDINITNRYYRSQCYLYAKVHFQLCVDLHVREYYVQRT